MFKKKELLTEAFIIAEVGQNHQGNFETAKEYIRRFSDTGVDAIKFQTRNNKYLFSEEAYNKTYNSENAFADVYGEHREKLELNPDNLSELKDECAKYGVKFMSTPFDEPSLDLLADIDVEIIKIASFDLGNLPFIKRIARKKIPVVMSVGGGKIDQIKSSVEILQQEIDEIAILHCVSEYPCEVTRLGLNNIEVLQKEFPDCTIGLSDHFSGTLSGPIGYMKGARVFEKHVTLNHAWKGTDHSFALEHHGFRTFVRDIRRVHGMFEPKPVSELGTELVFQKLGKSITAYNDIQSGKEITMDDLSGRIFNELHIPVRDSNKVIGKVANQNIKKGDVLNYDMLK